MWTGSETVARRAVREAVERGITFLHERQLSSGEFPCYVSTDLTLRTDRQADSSPFATALIAYSLGFVDSPHARTMLGRAATFLRSEMEGPGMWRYWTREHPHHSVIPADLDDVACASFVLRREGVAFPSNEALILANRDRGGRFHTWFAPRLPLPWSPAWWRVALWPWANPLKAYYFWKLNECAPDDVDGVVNANVLLYLGERPETLAACGYLADVLRAGREGECDKWHLNPFTFYYSVARAWQAGVPALGALRDEAVRRMVQRARSDGGIGDTALDTALAACALMAWESAPPELERAIEFLLAQQGEVGEWEAAMMWYGGPKRYCGWGSEALTTGFCLEALARYRLAHPGPSAPS
jgi:hypothetical protein